jgi:hypothetical protein
MNQFHLFNEILIYNLPGGIKGVVLVALGAGVDDVEGVPCDPGPLGWCP